MYFQNYQNHNNFGDKLNLNQINLLCEYIRLSL